MIDKYLPFRLLPLVAASTVCCSFSVNPKAGFKTEIGIYMQHNASQNERLEVKKRIKGFLHWYKANIQQANRFKLLDTDDQGYQLVNQKGCAAYLSFIQHSGFVSANYIAYWQKYFDDKALQLQKDKLTKDDVPEGFDFDLVLITQEPELVLDKIDCLQFKMVSLNKTKAVMSVALPSDGSVQYEFEMLKTSTGYKIDYISTANYD